MGWPSLRTPASWWTQVALEPPQGWGWPRGPGRGALVSAEAAALSHPCCGASAARSLKTGPPHPPGGTGAACAREPWLRSGPGLCDSSHVEGFQPGACQAWTTGAGVLSCPVFTMLAGSPSRLSVGEQPEVTHDPYEFLQSPEPAASTKS